MRIKSFIVLSLCFLLAFLNACNDSTNEEKEEILDVSKAVRINNPNKQSELSVLMRTLYNDTKAERILLLTGEHSAIDWTSKYENLLIAKQTDESNKGEVFDAYGNGFLIQLKEYQNTSEKERISNYNRLITNCKNCHEAYCPGPLVVINKLPLKDLN